MKAKTLEKLLLLEQTGELSKRQKLRLDAMPDVQEKRDELNALCAAVSVVTEEPSPWTVSKVDARLRKQRRFVLLPARVWKPILALAACLTIVVSTWDFKPAPSVGAVSVVVSETEAWTAQFSEDLVELESLILAISDSSLDISEMQ